ncbi:MAG: hypothetical protein IT210_10470 [Armatimonadetes bacterium]|nr:hypothetical protein [Armatimonadota bacterium]
MTKRCVSLFGFAIMAIALGPSFGRADTDPEAARNKAAQAVGIATDKLSFRQTMEWLGRTCHAFTGSEEERILVDATTGQICQVALPSRLRNSQEVKLSQEEAQTQAWKAAEGLGAACTSDMVLSETKFLDHGSAGKEYALTWGKYSPEGVILPTLLRVCVGAENGELTSFLYVDVAPKVALSPTIIREGAIQKAMVVSNLIKPTVEQAQLKVWFQKGQQVLWWIIKLKDLLANEAEVYLDAHTGEIFTVLGPLQRASASKARYDAPHLQPLLKAKGVELRVYFTRKQELAGKVIGKYIRKTNPHELDAILKKLVTMIKTQQSLDLSPLLFRIDLHIKFYAPGNRVYFGEYSPRKHYLYLILLEPVDPKTVKHSQRYRLLGKDRWVVAGVVLKTDQSFEQMIRRMAKQWDSDTFGEP